MVGGVARSEFGISTIIHLICSIISHYFNSVKKEFPFFVTFTCFFLSKRVGIQFVQLFYSRLNKISHEREEEIRRLREII
jgi:hypothetical protein